MTVFSFSNLLDNGVQTRSTMAAMPWPTPMHRLTRA
jgi:hypothetical protein